jgi:hypothetical protein
LFDKLKDKLKLSIRLPAVMGLKGMLFSFKCFKKNSPILKQELGLLM